MAGLIKWFPKGGTLLALARKLVCVSELLCCYIQEAASTSNGMPWWKITGTLSMEIVGLFI